MDKTKIQSINLKSADYIESNAGWQVFDEPTQGDCRAVELVMTDGNIRLFIIDSILIFNQQRKVSITISRYIKTPEDEDFILIDKPSTIFKDNELIISDDFFCSATDPYMIAILDKSITHDEVGNLKEGYITLWEAYKTNVGDPALFSPAQNSVYNKLLTFKNS